jgi:hypothetical protein
MSTTRELEARVDELRKMVNAPSPAEELAAAERQLRAAAETEARAAAEDWLKGNARAIGSHAEELREVVERIRENPNAKDIAAANSWWDKIKERLELAEIIVRRYPGIKVPKTPTVTPPGRRGLDMVSDLSITMPKRHLFPSILAGDSPKMRDATYQYEAHQWLIGRGSSLPEDLQGVLSTVVPMPDMSERIARDRADTAKQNAAWMRAPSRVV